MRTLEQLVADLTKVVMELTTELNHLKLKISLLEGTVARLSQPKPIYNPPNQFPQPSQPYQPIWPTINQTFCEVCGKQDNLYPLGCFSTSCPKRLKVTC